MAHNLTSALLITAIGMGLVFFAILLLWGLMALLARVPDKAGAAPEPPAPAREAAAEGGNAGLKQRAAAAAVAAALMLARSRGPAIQPPRPAEGGLSPWQAAARAGGHQSRSMRGRNR